MWNIGPIQIQKIHKYIQNMYPEVGPVEETKVGGKEGKKDSEQ
jgi:hypothetical protein